MQKAEGYRSGGRFTGKKEMDKFRIMNNMLWRVMERIGARGVTFVVSIILARMLDPDIYGSVALVTVITTILQVFVDSGMGNALIQKKDADDLDFSSVFFFNIAACALLYVGMLLAAPLIAGFYERPELTPIIRVLSLTLVISGVKNVQQAYVSRNMLFKRFFYATLGGTVFSAVVGIVMAYCGCGVWALVAQTLTNSAMGTVILWFTVKWRPTWAFSVHRLKKLFSFGWKLLVSALLDTIYNNLRSLIIGKKYSAADLAYYDKGKQFPNMIVANVNSSIDSVLLPAMAAGQDDRSRVRAMTRRAIQISSYIMMPLMVGLAVCAEPIVRLLLTEKWMSCVLYLQIFCVTYAFYPIHTANLNAMKAMGRSDLFLKLEVIKKAYGMVLLLIAMQISVEAMAYSLLVSTCISQVVNAWPNKKLLGYSYMEQVKDMLPQAVLSCAMGGCVYCVNLLGMNDLLTLLVQVLLGIAVYVGGSKVFKLDSFAYLWGMLKSFLNRKRAAK